MSVSYATRFDELKATGQLPSPTGVALAIMRLSESEKATVSEIARILQTDPALAGRVLKLANSSAFGRSRPVASIRDAVTHLGTRMVRNIALGFSLISQRGQGACQGFDYQSFWSQSLATAVAAQGTAHFTGQIAPSEAFTCGLLAQVGRLALASIYPDVYGEVLTAADPSVPDELCRLEREQFATDHNELSAAMLKDWGLPEPCVEAVQHHEQPDLSGLSDGSRALALTRLLHLALQMAAVCVAADEQRSDLLLGLFAASEKAGIPLNELIDLCDRVVGEWQEWGKVLQVTTQAVPSFAELAERARQAQQASTAHDKSEKDPATEVVPETASSPESASDTLTVVVVDDDPIQLRLLVRHLTADGHKVYTARDGEEALPLILELAPPLVITDWMMPRMDGVALCQALRQTKMGRQLYLIMLTGAEDEQSQVTAFEAGADDYLVKPFRPRLLAARLRACQRVLRLQEEVRRDKEELRRCMAELSVANRKLQQAALTDALTGLYNRRYAMDRLAQAWSESSRTDGPVAALIIDIDHFKRINDTYGHDIGDLVLRETAAVLRASVRGADVVCRLGGEEFLVIGSAMDLQAAQHCAERLRRSIAEHTVAIPTGELRVTLSVGVAVRQPAMSGPSDLLKAADQAVYAAKQAGRNRVCLAPGS